MKPMCDLCKRDFANWGNVYNHHRTQHDDIVQKYKCPFWPLCRNSKHENGIYQTLSNLRVHLHKHHNRHNREKGAEFEGLRIETVYWRRIPYNIDTDDAHFSDNDNIPLSELFQIESAVFENDLDEPSLNESATSAIEVHSIATNVDENDIDFNGFNDGSSDVSRQSNKSSTSSSSELNQLLEHTDEYIRNKNLKKIAKTVVTGSTRPIAPTAESASDDDDISVSELFQIENDLDRLLLSESDDSLIQSDSIAIVNRKRRRVPVESSDEENRQNPKKLAVIVDLSENKNDLDEPLLTESDESLIQMRSVAVVRNRKRRRVLVESSDEENRQDPKKQAVIVDLSENENELKEPLLLESAKTVIQVRSAATNVDESNFDFNGFNDGSSDVSHQSNNSSTSSSSELNQLLEHTDEYIRNKNLKKIAQTVVTGSTRPTAQSAGDIDDNSIAELFQIEKAEIEEDLDEPLLTDSATSVIQVRSIATNVDENDFDFNGFNGGSSDVSHQSSNSLTSPSPELNQVLNTDECVRNENLKKAAETLPTAEFVGDSTFAPVVLVETSTAFNKETINIDDVEEEIIEIIDVTDSDGSEGSVFSVHPDSLQPSHSSDDNVSSISISDEMDEIVEII